MRGPINPTIFLLYVTSMVKVSIFSLMEKSLNSVPTKLAYSLPIKYSERLCICLGCFDMRKLE